MAKNADIALLKKIDTVWSSVVASKQQIGDLNKLQKDSAPSVALYKPIIRVIIASGVDYSQIKPSETSLSLEIK